MRFSTPAAFSTEPQLDGQVLAGFDAWIEVAGAVGPIRTTQWLERRWEEDEFPFHVIFAGVERLLKQPRPLDLAACVPTCQDLAERLRPGDAEMSELFWQPVIRWAMETGDSELLLRAAEAATAILNTFDEPRTVGRIWLDVLNWSRQPGRETATDVVETAFERVIAAAERDGAQLYSARLEFAQVQFHRSHATAETVSGDWHTNTELFALWYSTT